MIQHVSGVRLVALVMVGVLALGTTACGSSNSPADALAGKSASQVLELALDNATKAGTMGYTITTQSGTGKQSVAGNASAKGGDVLVTNPDGVLHLVVIGATAYVKSDAAVLQSVLSLPAAAASGNADKWISVTSKETQFGPLAAATSFSSTLAEFTPGGASLRLTGGTVAGHHVGLIDGTGPSAVSAQTYDIQLVVTTKAPVLPIGGGVTVQGNGKKATQVAVFALWGKPLTLQAPTGATPLSAIAPG